MVKNALAVNLRFGITLPAQWYASKVQTAYTPLDLPPLWDGRGKLLAEPMNPPKENPM